MDGIASSTEELSATVNTMASAVEEMTVSIAEIAQNADNSAGIAKNAAATLSPRARMSRR